MSKAEEDVVMVLKSPCRPHQVIHTRDLTVALQKAHGAGRPAPRSLTCEDTDLKTWDPAETS